MHEPASNAQFDIRPATENDLAAIHEIYAECVLNDVASYEIAPPSPGEMRERFRSIEESGYPWLVAVCEGAVVGYAYASAFRTRPAYRWLVEDSIYLRADMRGRGLGRRLLDQLVAECQRRGFRQVVAVIGGSHPASIALHGAAGFVACGKLRASGFKFGRWLDTEFMQRELGEGDSTLPDETAYPGSLLQK